jgi:hypothetical protein
VKASEISGKLAAAVFAVCTIATPSFSQDGAKDLFYKQIDSPKTIINNGVQYWIELKRANNVSTVSNKYVFKSGDKFRLHVKTNTEAYAYIVLKEGRQGSKLVLFPDAQFKDNNKLQASEDYALPLDGWLMFDNNPGTENIILLFSRKPLDAQKYLADKTQKHVSISQVPNGAQDLIPGSVVLSYAYQDKAADASVAKPEQKWQASEDPSAKTEAAATTLVQTDPAQVLAVELVLQHLP